MVCLPYRGKCSYILNEQSLKKARIVIIAGTRPEIIKLAEFTKKMKKKFGNEFSLLYTGQHFSTNMKDIFFDELGVVPDYDLKCDTSDVAAIENQLLPFLRKIHPEYVIVYGDTYSTMAGALASLKMRNVRLIHLEAGIRDLDMTIPEERVRTYIDSISDYLFPPTELAKTFLAYEGIKNNIFVTGNLIVDVCKKMAKHADKHQIRGLPSEYLLLTMHRQENVDDPENLERLRMHLSNLRDKVVFPIHPRTRKNLEKYNIRLPDNVIGIDAAGYLEFMYLLKNCKLVMTDSGGVTEEAMILKKPCITLRHSTARWETILLKANTLFPLDRKDSLGSAISEMLQTKIRGNPYGVNVAERTCNQVSRIVKK
jgi:UDP-N-acetylglucosamine 2-epimerase (non-hydrolysing)